MPKTFEGCTQLRKAIANSSDLKLIEGHMVSRTEPELADYYNYLASIHKSLPRSLYSASV